MYYYLPLVPTPRLGMLRLFTMKLSIALVGVTLGTALAEVPKIVAKVSDHDDYWLYTTVTEGCLDQGSKFFYSNNGTEL